MKIGLFFGSFNPVHIGHLIVANHFVEFSDIEMVWFVVSPQNPLKEKNSLLNPQSRLRMVSAAIRDNPRFKVCDAEFDLPKPSYTIDTLRFLKKKYLSLDFTVLMGSDAYTSLPEWKEYYSILSDFPIYVYPRRDFPLKMKGASKEKNVTLFDFPYLDISATYIRRLMSQGKSLQYLVPEKALKILER